MTLVRISPDGKEVLHLYDDKLMGMTSKTSEVEVERASDVYYDGKASVWKVKILATGEILPVSFGNRSMALSYEKIVLEGRLRDGAV